MQIDDAKQKREKIIFEEYPIVKALAVMIVPTIISQLIHVVYNISDTWFIGLLNEAAAVAAVSLCFPMYNVMTALSNLFGIGCASVIGRYLGAGRQEKVKKNISVAAWSAVCAALLYAAVFYIGGTDLLRLIGAEDDSVGYAYSYMFITMIVGAVPTILSATLAHIIRATGNSGVSSFGLSLGAVCNIFLDPLFMFVILPDGYEVVGAAIATLLSNVISLIYFVAFMLRHNERGFYAIAPISPRGCGRTLLNIIKCGLPSFLMVAMANSASSILNSLTRTYGGSEAVAGLGIARKIDAVAYSVNQGITQGMLPLVAYCYAAGRARRMKSAIKISAITSFGFSALCSTLSYILAPELIGLFIKDPATIAYGAQFLRILCFAVPIYSVTYVIIATFQAMGRFIQPLILSMRRGIVDTVLFFVIRAAAGPAYMFWATPIMEMAAMVTGLIMLSKETFPDSEKKQT